MTIFHASCHRSTTTLLLYSGLRFAVKEQIFKHSTGIILQGNGSVELIFQFWTCDLTCMTNEEASNSNVVYK